MTILAIDPGTRQSGYVLYDPSVVWWSPHSTDPPVGTQQVATGDVLANDDLLLRLRDCSDPSETIVAIEDIRSYGQAVGYETLETMFWVGRFYQAATSDRYARVVRLPRMEVKKHLCGTHRAKDPDVRDALLRRFGPGRADAVGTKATPGPLYGIRSHCWAALALAVTVADATTKGDPDVRRNAERYAG